MKPNSTILGRIGVCFITLFLALRSHPQTTIIPYGSSWKYWANSLANYQANWNTVAYNDAAWPSGTGELGYGDGDEGTCIPSNSPISGTLCTPTGNKWGTYYFRYVINIPDPTVYSNFTFNVERDDGFVLYINGTEYQRNNIAAGAVSYITAATSAVEDAVITFNVANTAFVAGNNTIAVEMHQNPNNASGLSTSSDISFNLQLLGNDAFSAGLTRGPYLQVGTKNSIVIRWRTSAAENSKIELGTTFGTYPITVNDAAIVTEHIVTVPGLSTDTKYYYRIGNSTNMQLPDANQFFTTLPADNPGRKIRITAFGDCGRNSATYQDNNLTNYLNYLTANSIEAPDAWILLGDNAYNTGSEAEYTSNFFNIYGTNILKNHKLYPAPGNHDYGNNSANKPSRAMPYHTIFSVPQNGEAGGVASTKQNFYSFDVGNIHFLSLDSYGTEADGTSIQTAGSSTLKTWLDADLAANTKKWTIAYWHHPPYTKSSHNSDSESDLVNIRQNFITFLETRGVDLIICGHSHAYERGYLLRNFTGSWTSFTKAAHTADSSSATYTSSSTCPYTYNSSPLNHGTVYVVAGSAGASGGTNTNFAAYAMPFAVNDAGLLYFEVDDNRLDAKMLRRNGTIFDQFTIMKDVDKTTTYNIFNGNSQTLTASWPGNYNWILNTSGSSRSVNVTPPNNSTTPYKVTDAFGCVTDSFSVVTSGILPVSVLEYTASLMLNGTVELKWKTGTEADNDFYNVERSSNGRDYSVIGTVDGAGNSTSEKNYVFTDPNPLPGTSFYRLSQTNFNGSHEYLGVKKIENLTLKDFEAKTLYGYAGKIVLQISSVADATYYLTVFDINGRKWKDELLRVSAGFTRKEITLPPGVYIWEVKNKKGESMLQKVIVQ
jgi:hypothetical protein